MNKSHFVAEVTTILNENDITEINPDELLFIGETEMLDSGVTVNSYSTLYPNYRHKMVYITESHVFLIGRNYPLYHTSWAYLEKHPYHTNDEMVQMVKNLIFNPKINKIWNEINYR